MCARPFPGSGWGGVMIFRWWRRAQGPGCCGGTTAAGGPGVVAPGVSQGRIKAEKSENLLNPC